MNHLDLCSGIGGFALAAGWNGYTTIGFCEIDPWCRRVLAKNFPGVPQHDDLKTLTAATVRGWIGTGAGVEDRLLANAEHARRDAGAEERAGMEQRAGWPQKPGGPLKPAERGVRRDIPTLDLITGGYPCQPFSLAGKRMGAEDDRHLWPYIAALVADLKPRRCLFENVYGHVSMGLDAVLSDLEALGYACGAVVVPACAVGAPHRRDRVWILADTERGGGRELLRTDAAQGTLSAALRTQGASGVGSGGEDVSDADNWEALSDMGDTPDGLSRWMVGPSRRDPWAGDWEAGCSRVTTSEQDRTHKLKALGNAIVPQVAYEILRCWIK
jgi:DNA (cytosine-5)-methyltransferase 1